MTILSYEPLELSSAMEPCGRIRQANTASGGQIDSETERTCVGMLRTAVHTSWSRNSIANGPMHCWWDKQTGVLVEMYITGNWTAVAVETNMWQPSNPANPAGGALDPAILYSLAIVAIAIVISTVFLVIRRMRKPPEIEIPKP